MRRLTWPLALVLALAPGASLLAPDVLAAQESAATRHRDVIRGRVTSDGGAPVPDADVIATRAPDRLFLRTHTDAQGRFEIAFDSGTGDYLVHASAVGFEPFRRRVTRTGADSLLAVDVVLKRKVQQLEQVTVKAQKPKPDRGPEFGTGTGASEQLAQGVNGAVPPDQAGDIAATAALVPGVTPVDGGISVLGLGAGQNSSTLNGMAFPGASVPADVRTRTRVTTSSYDPARGWFGGANVNTEIGEGNLFAGARGHLVLDAPSLQATDPIAARIGQRYTNLQGGLGSDGPLGRSDRWFYNTGIQGQHRTADAASLLDADADLLEHVGVAADSVARLRGLLGAAGIPLTAGGADAHTLDDVQLLARLDRAPYDWETFTPARRTYGLTAYGKLARTGPAAGPFALTATPAHQQQSTQGIASVQGLFSSYFYHDWLEDARTGLSLVQGRQTPFLSLPDGRVLVSSAFPDGSAGVSSLSFGGAGTPATSTRQWTWESSTSTQLYARGKETHRVKLDADARLDGVTRDPAGDRFGSFAYQSLADLAANHPASFTRTLVSPTRTGGEWNGFVSIGDLWRVSPKLQLAYGARLEGNAFTTAPAYNPDVERLFGARTDARPNTVHASPRLGFTWLRGQNQNWMRSGPLGTFYSGPTGVLRGGIGEFRSLIVPDLLADASAATGLPGALQTLTCVGAAVPTPDWARWAADPSTLPTTCAGDAPSLSHLAPDVQLFDRSYTAARSWRGNLAYSSTFLRHLNYTLEGIWSLNLDQPGRTDLNFAGRPAFATSDEGRPVYAPPSVVDPASGVIAPGGGRVSTAYGSVTRWRSDLRSVSRQATLTLEPNVESFAWHLTASYTLASIRAQRRGFDGATFGDPTAREWARGDLDARHQFLAQAGYSLHGVTLTMLGRLTSGLPFTPVVGSDVNGDGLANDRAFIYDLARAPDPAVGQALQSLLAGAPANVRRCLTSQRGQAAGRNSCEGPWTAGMNAQLALNGRTFHLGRVTSVALSFANPLGGLDQLLHGSDHLRGWGTPAFVDPVLYQVRGFDPSAGRFAYTVNPRFGDTRPASSALRAPFRVSLSAQMDLGTPIPRQQLERWLRPGRAGVPGPRLDAAALKKRYRRNAPDPYQGILQEADSLLLTPSQVDALAKARQHYVAESDTLWDGLTTWLSALPDEFDAAEAMKRQEATTDSAWALAWHDLHTTLPTILSPVQLRVLPWPASMIWQWTEPPKGIRIVFFGG